jgi:hypothetical protein
MGEGGDGRGREGKSAFNVFQGIIILEISINYNQVPDNTCFKRWIYGS